MRGRRRAEPFMGEIINLRRHRKTKARQAAADAAAANRAAFGRTKAERDTQAAIEKLELRRLDGHKRDEPTDE